MDINSVRCKIKKAVSILEDATTASLAPYPETPVGDVVTINKKKYSKNEPKKEHRS